MHRQVCMGTNKLVSALEAQTKRRNAPNFMKATWLGSNAKNWAIYQKETHTGLTHVEVNVTQQRE